jgi:hypothetical protein
MEDQTMIRTDSRKFETDLGTFYVNFDGLDDDGQPKFAAETESGNIVVNGIAYRGTVYSERYRKDGEMYASTRHVNIWNEKARKWMPVSESAHRKIRAALLPIFEQLATDTSAVNAYKVAKLQSEHAYKLREANERINDANDIANELRASGVDVADVSAIS